MTSPVRRSTLPPARGGGRVSGAIFLDQLHLAEEMLGKAVIDGAIAGMEDWAKEEVRSLLPVSWISIAAAADFHLAVARATNQDVVIWHRKLVRLGMERTFSTVWRFFLQLTSVEHIVKRTAVMFSKSYDRGAASGRLVEPGLAEIVVTDWPDIPKFEVDAIISGVEAVLHLAKKASATIKAERNAGGVRFEVRFQD